MAPGILEVRKVLTLSNQGAKLNRRYSAILTDSTISAAEMRRDKQVAELAAAFQEVGSINNLFYDMDRIAEDSLPIDAVYDTKDALEAWRSRYGPSRQGVRFDQEEVEEDENIGKRVAPGGVREKAPGREKALRKAKKPRSL